MTDFSFSHWWWVRLGHNFRIRRWSFIARLYNMVCCWLCLPNVVTCCIFITICCRYQLCVPNVVVPSYVFILIRHDSLRLQSDRSLKFAYRPITCFFRIFLKWLNHICYNHIYLRTLFVCLVASTTLLWSTSSIAYIYLFIR